MKRSLKAWLGVASALALLGTAGCGGGSGASATAPPPAPRSVSATLPDGLTATLAEDKSSIPVGGAVTYTLTLANNTAQPITYQPVFGGGGLASVPASLRVTDPQGGLAFPLGVMPGVFFIGPNTTLAPGQSVSGVQAVGDNKDLGRFPTVGRYTASAVFTLQAGQGDAAQTTTAGPLTVDAQ